MVPLATAKSDHVESRPVLTAGAGAVSGADAVTIGAGTSFYWAMRMLPLERRRAIFAVYAFCREVDDIADGDEPTAGKVAALAEWRARIERLFGAAGTSGTAPEATSPLAAAIADFDLERDAFLAIIDGMEMDATGPIIAPAMAELEIYCSRVAAAVGLLCIRIFGDSGEDGRRVAASLGLALQLTNILRDIKEDAEMGRLYLPRELLQDHGIAARDPIEVLHHPDLPAVCRALARRAQAEFTEAEAAIARCSRRAMRPAMIMMKVYQRTLGRLRRRDWRDVAVFEPSPLARVLDKAGKLLIALRFGFV